MLIEIHAIQNHSPSNLNRDDLGAPKTCWFGGALRSRISSQALKRSIRTSKRFQDLNGGIRTRRLAEYIAEAAGSDPEIAKRARAVLEICGVMPRQRRGRKAEDAADDEADGSKALVYTTHEAVREIADLIRGGAERTDQELAADVARCIAERTAVPDMALSGRMLEPDASANDVWKPVRQGMTVEASLQVAHAISTHSARPEIDYYVAADDRRGTDAGAGYVDEAMFTSACFYKYFSIDFDALAANLTGFGAQHRELAAHTVGAFICAMATVTPSGKQNSFAANNPPDGILVEIRDTPISYVNAFARPVDTETRYAGESAPDVVERSIRRLGQYVFDMEQGYGAPGKRIWFSPNDRYGLTARQRESATAEDSVPVSGETVPSLDGLVRTILGALGCDWDEVQKVRVAGGKLA